MCVFVYKLSSNLTGVKWHENTYHITPWIKLYCYSSSPRPQCMFLPTVQHENMIIRCEWINGGLTNAFVTVFALNKQTKELQMSWGIRLHYVLVGVKFKLMFCQIRYNLKLIIVESRCVAGLIDVTPEWVKNINILNGTNPGSFQIRFQYILAQWAKMYWNQIWKIY